MSDVVIRVRTDGTTQARDQLKRVISKEEFAEVERFWNQRYNNMQKTAEDAVKKVEDGHKRAMASIKEEFARGSISAKEYERSVRDVQDGTRANILRTIESLRKQNQLSTESYTKLTGLMDGLNKRTVDFSNSAFAMQTKVLSLMGPKGTLVLGIGLAAMMMEGLVRRLAQGAAALGEMGRQAASLGAVQGAIGLTDARLGQLSGMAAGTIPSAALARGAWQGGGQGISPNQFAELVSYSRRLGLVNGVSPSDMLTQLIQGVRNPTGMSTILGQRVSQRDVNARAESMFGRPLTAMTELERESAQLAIGLAILRDRMRQIKEPQDSVVDGFDRLKATLADLKGGIGTLIGWIYRLHDAAAQFGQGGGQGGFAYGKTGLAPTGGARTGTIMGGTLAPMIAAPPPGRRFTNAPAETIDELETRASAALSYYRALVDSHLPSGGAASQLRGLSGTLGARAQGADPATAARLLSLQKQMADALRAPLQQQLADNRALLDLFNAQAGAGTRNLALAQQLAGVYRQLMALGANTGLRPEDRSAALGLAGNVSGSLSDVMGGSLAGYMLGNYRPALSGMPGSSRAPGSVGSSRNFTGTQSFADLVKRQDQREFGQQASAQAYIKQMTDMQNAALRFGDSFFQAMLHAAAGADTFAGSMRAVAQALTMAVANEAMHQGVARLVGSMSLGAPKAGASAGASAAGAASGAAGSAGVALASSNPYTGAALIAGSLALAIGSRLFQSHEAEQTMYRAQLRALRDAREKETIINIHVPDSPVDFTNPRMKEALAEGIEGLTGTRSAPRINFITRSGR